MAPILLQLANTANSSLLQKHLGRSHTVRDASGQALPAGDFDLAIVDGQHLQEFQAEIRARKDAEAPMILPFLLLVERAETELSSWALGNLVEDILVLPVTRKVLEARISNLLRLRSMSRQQQEYARNIELAYKREDRALRMVQKTNRAVTQAKDEQELLDRVCDTLVSVGHYPGVYVGYTRGERETKGRIRCVAASNQGAESGPRSVPEESVLSCPEARALNTGEYQIVGSDAAGCFQTRARELQAAMVIPLVFEDTTYGVLTIHADDRAAFDPKEIGLLQSLALDLSFGIAVQRHQAKRRKDQQQIRHLAYYDPLTGLPNRKYFMEILEATVQEGVPAAVLFVDLDNFKLINDALGHKAGDEFLGQVAKRLQNTMRSTDLLARLGGDEFVLLLKDEPRDKEKKWTAPDKERLSACAQMAAKRYVQALKEPISIAGYEHHLEVSIGISLYPFTAQGAGQLVEQADIAMYASKGRELSAYTVYSESMASVREQRLSMEESLRQALKNEEFQVVYQPIVCLETGRVHGMEALIRWRQADGSLVSPGQFLPVACETGLIVPIGQWVLETACRQLHSWIRAGWEITMNVNVDARQISSPGFMDSLKKILSQEGIPPGRLTLELTEESMLSDPDIMGMKIKMLRDIDVEVAIDDFGTGYSSLNRLQTLPISILKIDKSFVQVIASDQSQAPVVKTALSLANDFGIQTVAEGIEDEVQYEYLQNLGCALGQGFYISRPQPAEEMTAWLDGQEADHGKTADYSETS